MCIRDRVRTGGDATRFSKIKLHSLADGGVIETGSSLTSLTAAQLGAGSISAPVIKKLVVTGDKKLALAADMAADIELTGTDTAGLSLGSLKAGRVSDASID